MFLREKSTGDLVEVMRIEDVYDPCLSEIMGRTHAGEEIQDPTTFTKAELVFPSGEALPRCWVDPEYAMLKARAQSFVIQVS